MAILDALTLFDDNVALTTSRNSTNTLDLGQERDLGALDAPLRLEFRFSVLPLPGTATVTIGFYTSSDNSTFILLEQLQTISASAYTAAAPWGLMKLLPVPSGTRRYLRLAYTIGAGPLTAGTIISGLVAESEYNTKLYPRAFVS